MRYFCDFLTPNYTSALSCLFNKHLLDCNPGAHFVLNTFLKKVFSIILNCTYYRGDGLPAHSKTINQQISPYCCFQFFTLGGQNESDHLASSINLVIDVLIVTQLIEHLDCCLSLFKVFGYIAQQPACGGFWWGN